MVPYKSTILFLSFLWSSRTSGFVPQNHISLFRPAVLTTLGSTLAPETPGLHVADDDSKGRGALSMQIDELAEVLGGKGRAQIVWDCYSIVRDEEIFPLQLPLICCFCRRWSHIFNFNCRELNQPIFMEAPST